MNTENKQSKGLPIGVRRAIAYIVLIFMSILCLVWFYILFVNATRSKGELTRGFTPIPSTHLIENLSNGVFHGTLPFVRGMLNSLFVAGCSAALCTYFSTMTAYAIHVYDFKMKKFMSTFILAVMMIPQQVTALGFLQLVGRLKLEDNFIPLIVPAVAAPVTYFYMKQYMESTLPLSLVEAARIDGANTVQSFLNIVLPLTKPIASAVIVLTLINSWNAFLLPLLFLQSPDKQTVTLLPQFFQGEFTNDQTKILAAAVMTAIPEIAAYLCMQKNFERGMSAGALK